MQTLFLSILNMSVTASYVIAAVLLIRLLLKRAPKKYAYLLWVVVLFRLVCPLSIDSDFSIFNTPSLGRMTTQGDGEAAQRHSPAIIKDTTAPRGTTVFPETNSIMSESLPSATPAASSDPMQIWIALGAAVWGAGAAALLAYGMVSFWRLKRRMATAIRLDHGIYESDRIRSPFILGLIKPRIYIPFGLSEQERKYVLLHEACHLRRGDHFVKLIAFAVLALHWFNPLVWIAFARMARDMEMSCDERVLAKTGPGSVKDYSMSLLAFAANRRLPSASPLAFGETAIRERMNNILRYKKPGKPVILFSSAVCILVAVACATNPTVNGAATGPEEIYGKYSFDDQVYMNLLSSFIATEGYKEYYTFTENSLIIADEAGRQQIMDIEYAGTSVDERTFKISFGSNFDVIEIPDIVGYKERYRYTLADPDVNPGYQLYLLDDEVWLAKTVKDGSSGNNYIWSIYKISKLADESPGKTTIAGTQDGVAEFLTLQSFTSAYDQDTSYNVTPEYIKEHSEYRIFKYDVSSASFLLYEGEVYSLGEWKGGHGITSMALADLDNDGQSELVFTYSFGSGIHRSNAAYFNPATREVTALGYTHLNGDMILRTNEDGSLSLFEAAISNFKDAVNFDIEGTDFIANLGF